MGRGVELSVKDEITLAASLVLGLKVAYLMTLPAVHREMMAGSRSFQALMKIDYLYLKKPCKVVC